MLALVLCFGDPDLSVEDTLVNKIGKNPCPYETEQCVCVSVCVCVCVCVVYSGMIHVLSSTKQLGLG